MVGRAIYLIKDIFFSDLKRVYNNYRQINATTIIGKARLIGTRINKYCSFADYSFVVNSEIGSYSSVGRSTTIIHTKVGKFCSISWNVSIGATRHYLDRLSTHSFYYLKRFKMVKEDTKIVEKTNIGNDVWIGANAIVMPNLTIGNGAVIGAGSVVTKNVPSYAVVAGVPAKILRYRFETEKIRKIEALNWWDWDRTKLNANINLFNKPF